MEHPTAPAAAAARLSLADVVARSGASAQLLSDCESLGLLDDTAHAGRYDERAVSTLRFVRRAHTLGFDTPEVVELHALWQDGRRASFDVKRVALERADDLAQRIEELAHMKRLLERLAHCCEGDERPECPILDELAGLKGFAGCEARRA
ncbi:MerR family DNA-binding protein [Variovorax boronicumulans]|uniref:MerR family DNA-binding protein n=1 Tax=Variovorax boronicumulans TaxID=436515 RepID=UPI0012E66734|nr:MerR family DNA-binding protein [Variovorax boronicumulans]GER10651.1 MerR family transcriptional regulator [Variovorax boronicumulans]